MLHKFVTRCKTKITLFFVYCKTKQSFVVRQKKIHSQQRTVLFKFAIIIYSPLSIPVQDMQNPLTQLTGSSRASKLQYRVNVEPYHSQICFYTGARMRTVVIYLRHARHSQEKQREEDELRSPTTNAPKQIKSQ